MSWNETNQIGSGQQALERRMQKNSTYARRSSLIVVNICSYSFKDATSSLLDQGRDLEDIVAKDLLLIVDFAFTVCNILTCKNKSFLHKYVILNI